MPSVFRKLLFLRNLVNRRKPDPDEIVEEKWIADFSRQKNVRFNIKSESSFDANIRKNLFYSGYSLALALKKNSCIAWVEAPEHRYRDLVISGTVRVDARGGYGAGGVLFRMVDSGTYYSLLISNKGYFRLDVLRNGMPFPLVGWTELPLSGGAALGPDQNVDFSVIAYGSHIVVLLRGRWAAEINDSSILEGTVCFTAASYESGYPEGNLSLSQTADRKPRGSKARRQAPAYKIISEEKQARTEAGKNPGAPKNSGDVSYTAEAFLESLTIDSRIAEVSTLYEKWRDSPEIDSRARLNLAETYTAMDQYNAAMVQLRKCWDTQGHRKTQRELLLAGRLALQLGLMADAENYTSQCFQADVESPEGKEAVTEMAKILYAGERFGELKDYCAEAIKIKSDDPVLWTFRGHAFWNLNEYKNAASAYDRASELDEKNGIPAKNAANVYDVMGRKKDALKRYLEAGRIFLQAGNYNDLGLLVPKLLSLGENVWEARSLAGKWAFAVEDWDMAEKEFAQAEKLRKSRRSKLAKDGAQVFLEALLLIRAGKRREALPLLEEAVSLEKDYALFHFRLAENLFLLDDNPDDPLMLRETNAALALMETDDSDEEISAAGESEGLAGWINNFAAQVALRKGNLDAAAKHLEKAAQVLGDLPAVKVNRGVLFYLRGSVDKALEILDGDKQDDPEGVMANCAGNLLVRSGRFEEADEKYRKALAAGPDNVEYLSNRSSCLMELGLYGEADELLARALTIAPSPALLEMISYVAAKKGEYPRAEQACRSALEINPSHAPSLLSLGWLLFTMGRQEEARALIQRLDQLELKEDIAKGRDELRTRLDDLVYRTIECASCGHGWRLLRDPPRAPSMRLYAMPPDDLPAGSCPECGKTYCIGCAKNNLDPQGRFICPACKRSLKLINEGLKKIIHDWAAKDGLIRKKTPAGIEKPGVTAKRVRASNVSGGSATKVTHEKNASALRQTDPQTETPAEIPPESPVGRGRGRPRKTEQAPALAATPAEQPVMRKRGRPRKTEQVSAPPPVKRPRGRPPKTEK